ncbi:membrane protein [Mycobacterium phage Dynamo]|nr:membrane protein [Mycobacterium phage Dynamo]
MDRYTVFGIEKPFPWVGAIGGGLLVSLAVMALAHVAFSRGWWPIDELIEHESLFHF